MGKRGKKVKKKRITTDPTPASLNTEDHDAAGKENLQKTKFKCTVDQLLDRAEEYIDTFEYELAQKFCQRALELDADNIRGLETSGTLLLELGDMEAAKRCFGRAVELQPEEGHSKYMYLGQLFTGSQAVHNFLKGIDLMKKYLDSANKNLGAAGAMEGDISNRDVSAAYCAVAEIYLTDECFEEDAELKCKEYLDGAVESDDSNPEAYQLLASYWLSLDNKQNAKEMIEKSVSLWLPQLREAHKAEGASVDPVQVSPISYPARIQAAKTLIEVENFDCANEVLEMLLEEEDEVVEVWYLLGWLNYLQDEDYRYNARFYLQKAKEVAGKVGCDDVQIAQHIEELLEELGPGDDEEEGEEVTLDDPDSDDDNEDAQMDTDNTDTQTAPAVKEQTMEH